MKNFAIKHVQEVDSTNNYLKKLIRNQVLEEGTVILADYQKSGKGQGQNSWHSGKGLNLTFSLLLHPGIYADQFFYLTEIVSLAITDFLFSCEINASIKWPNDIYVNDLKIAGILIENSITENEVVICIAGIGINVNEMHFPSDLLNPTSMRIQKDKSFNTEVLMDLLLDTIQNRYNQLLSEDLKSLHNEYNRRIYKRGISAEYKDKRGLFKAELKEIRSTGEMVLKKEDHTGKAYLFGEIEMII